MIYFVIVIQQLLASTTHLVAQHASLALPPSVVMIFRCSIASLAFLLLLFPSVRHFNVFHNIEREDWPTLIGISVLNVPINQFLYLSGIEYTTPTNSALLYSLTPALVFIFTLVQHRERPSARKALGIVVAFIGVMILMLEHGAALRPEHTTGNILILIAVVAWALYTMGGKSLVNKYGALQITGLNMILGTLFYLPFALIFAPSINAEMLQGNIMWYLVYLAIFSSVINYILWFWALKRLDATKVAIFQNLQPIFTTMMALYFGKVVLTEQLVGGGILTLIGVVLVQLG